MPGTAVGTGSEVGAETASSPAARNIPAASPTLNIPQPKVPAVSSVTIAAISSARDSSRSPAAPRRSRRSVGAVVLQPSKAPAAAATASSTSAERALAATVTSAPVNELTTRLVAPACASRHTPSTKSCWTAVTRLLQTSEPFP
jgi:hypothetical protein